MKIIRGILLLTLPVFAGVVPAGAQSSNGNPRLLQGPMVGAVTTDSAWIWSRSNDPWEIKILYDTAYPFTNLRSTEPVRARKQEDYIVKCHLTGMSSGPRYYYRIQVNDRPDRLTRDLPAPSFSTAPGRGAMILKQWHFLPQILRANRADPRSFSLSDHLSVLTDFTLSVR